jgi:hypothetical protein
VRFLAVKQVKELGEYGRDDVGVAKIEFSKSGETGWPAHETKTDDRIK